MKNKGLISIFIAVVIVLNIINIAKHVIFYDSPENAYKVIYNREVYEVVGGRRPR